MGIGSVVKKCSVVPVLGMMLVAQSAPQALAQQPAERKALAPVVKAEEAANEMAQPHEGKGGEGIKVHGHWKLDFKKPDGTIDHTYEFENSLVTAQNGDVLLAGLLTSNLLLSGWMINVNLAQQTGACAGGCTIIASHTTAATGNTTDYYLQQVYSNVTPFSGLTVTSGLDNHPTPDYIVTFNGTFTSPSATTITNVGTGAVFCQNLGGPINITQQTCFQGIPGTYSPSTGGLPSGYDLNYRPFTGTTLPTPQAVAAGQIVQVTVTISFS